MKSRIFSFIFVFFVFSFLAASSSFFSCVAYGENAAFAEYPDQVNLAVGELEGVPISALTRVSIADPSIADVVSTDEKEILLIGKSIGQTTLFIWDEKGKRKIVILVSQQDIKEL